MCVKLLTQLATHAAQRPHETFLIEADAGGAGRALTWREFHERSAAFAASLRSVAHPGDVVVLSCPNTIEFHIALVATLMAGATVFPVAPDLTPVELGRALSRARATVLVAPSEIGSAHAGDVKATLPLDDVLAAREVDSDAPPPPRHDAVASAGLILLSSGTTGLPKAIYRTAAALDAVAQNCCESLRVSPRDTILISIPMPHPYGIEHGLLAPILGGATVRLCARFSLAAVESELVAGAATVIPCVPFMFEMLARTERRVERSRAPRLVYSAGGLLPRSVFDSFQSRFGVAIGQIYGASEFGSVTFSDPESPCFNPNSVGTPMGDVELRILDLDYPRIDHPLPHGEEGQIAIAGSSVMERYIGESEPPLSDGFFLSGDIGRFDSHGNLIITGRMKLLINVGGMKVNPMEVEEALVEYPDVQEAMVVAVKVSETLARPKAILAPRPGCTIDIDRLKSFLRERLSPHKTPREFEILDSLPRTASGKLVREVAPCA